MRPGALKLLVFCDGFDELRAEETAALKQSEFRDFTANLLAGLDVEAKVVVTCRDRHLKGGREEENRVFQHRNEPHTRRVLLPFRSSQIDEYIGKWISGSASTTGSELPMAPADIPPSEQLEAAPNATGTNHEAGSVNQASAATPVNSQTDPKLTLLQYQLTIQSSESLQQIVRNPFVLRLFVDALPQLSDANGRVDVSTVTRYAIYSVFVRRYITRQLKEKCRLDGGKWMLPVATRSQAVQNVNAGDDVLIDDVERLCCLIAGEMFARSSLTVEMDAQHSMWASLRDNFFEFDAAHVRSRARANWDAMRPVDQFPFKCDGVDETAFVERAVRSAQHCRWVTLKHAKQLCPLRKLGEGYSFLHKSFYEYFLAKLVLSLGSDPLRSEEQRVQRMASVLGSGGRAWQSEPEAIYFLCDKWWATGAHEPASDVQSTRRCLFGVVKASSAGSSQPVVGANDVTSSSGGSAQHAAVSASANAATLLNWLNEPFSGVQWDGVQLAGADLSFAVFVGASLRDADLSNCMLKKAVLSGADLTGANLEGVNFAERAPKLLEGYGEIKAFVSPEGSPYEYRLEYGDVTVYTSAGVHRVSLHGNGAVRSLTATGGYLAGVCESGDGIVWETRNFTRIWCRSEVGCLALSNYLDKSLLIAGGVDGSVAVWDADLRQLLSTVQLSRSAACTVICVDDDCFTVGVGLASGAINLLHMNDERNVLASTALIFGDGAEIAAISFSSFDESQLIAGCSPNSLTVKVWSCNTGECLYTLSGHGKPVRCVAFTPRAQGRLALLATGSDDCDCRLWDVASGQQYGPALQGHTDAVLSVRFEPGEHGMLVSWSADDRIRYWDIDSANSYRERLQVSDRVIDIRETPEGTGFVSVDEKRRLLNWTICREVDGETVLRPRCLQGGDAMQTDNDVCSGRVDASGNAAIVIGCPNGALNLRRNGLTLSVGNCGTPIVQVCYASEYHIATGTNDGSVQLWSIVNGSATWTERTLQAGNGYPITCMACCEVQSPLLACVRQSGKDEMSMMSCWDLGLDKDEPLYTLHWASEVTVMRSGPPGKAHLLAISVYGIIELRDARNGCVTNVLTGSVLCWLSTSRLASGANPFVGRGDVDRTVRVWDVDTGLCLHTITSVSKVQQLLTVPNANAFVALCDDGVIRVWDAYSCELLTQSRSHIAGPFALETLGVKLSSSTDIRLLETGGLNGGLDALVSAVTTFGSVTPGESEQFTQALAHRLSAPARDALIRAFQKRVLSPGLAEGLEVVLLNLIAMSKADETLAVAAGNAASCLNQLCSSQQTTALAGLNWTGVRMTGADLRGADLSATAFEGATLIDCDFSGATLTEADFSGVDLAASKLANAERVLPGSCSACSPPRADGSHLLASVIRGAIIQVWQPDTGDCIAELKGHTGAIRRLTFGTRCDGTLLLASAQAGEDKTVRLWDVNAGGDAVAVLCGHTDTVTHLSFGTRPDGRLLLASASVDNTLRLWDVEAGGECVATLSGHSKRIRCLFFGTRSDGRLVLASGSEDNTVRLWDLESSPVACTVLEGHTREVWCIGFGTRSDGRLLLASGSADKTVRVWDVEVGGDAVVLSGHTDSVECISFGTRSDGKLLLACSGYNDFRIHVWNVEANLGEDPIVLSGHTSSVLCLHFFTRPDGRLMLASGCYDDTARLWDIEAGGDAVVLGGLVGGVISLFSFVTSTFGKLLLACETRSENVWLWDLDPLLVVLSSKKFGATAAIASGLASSDQLSPWAFEPGQPCLPSGECVAAISVRGFGGLAVSPDGSCCVVSDTKTHSIRLYSLPDGALQAEFGSKGSGPGQLSKPRQVCFTSWNSRNILVADRGNKRAQEITLAGEHVRTIGEGVIDGGAMGIAANGVMIAVTAKDKVYLFDATGGELIRSFGCNGEAELNPGELNFCGIRFAPNGGPIIVIANHVGVGGFLLLFSLSGESSRSIRREYPHYDVDFASNGDIVVASIEVINVFSPDGSTLLRSFGGKVHGRTLSPVAFAVHFDKLLVLDANRDGSCVHVFK